MDVSPVTAVSKRGTEGGVNETVLEDTTGNKNFNVDIGKVAAIF